MKRGKKYQDAVKAFDKKEQYDVADAISIVKRKMLQLNLTRQSSFILEQAATGVTQSSRSVVRLYYHTEQEKQLKF